MFSQAGLDWKDLDDDQLDQFEKFTNRRAFPLASRKVGASKRPRRPTVGSRKASRYVSATLGGMHRRRSRTSNWESRRMG